MEFLILGPLEARERGQTLPLGGAKQRALLAMLLLHAGEVVASDRLMEELWGEAAPGAAKALSVAVARLRRTLEPAGADRMLVTRAPGYALQLDGDDLDLRRFERLAYEGRSAADPATAAARLHEALAIWRGPPLADLAYEAPFQAEIVRLEELRLAALEDRVEADLALGRHAALIGELDALVAEHPLRERLRGQLMLALYRSGRQAEALEAYRAGRESLVDELGIEPGRRLRELHQAILEQDAALEAAAPPRAPAPGGGGESTAVFVGRARELAELRSGVDDAFAGLGHLFLLAGEPGIGKSRLAEELTRHARARGATVLVGRCWEAGGAPAYWPWIQALRGYVRACDAGTLAEQAGAGAPDLVQVVPELSDRLPGLPPPSTLEPELVRFRLFDATAEFLRRAGEARPIVLVLDDLHAADEASLLLLRFLAREVGADRLLLVAAYREVDPRAGEPLAEMVAEVSREPTCRRIELHGLREPEVAEYLDRAAAELSSPRLAAAVHERTEGNPLFVGELVRLLAIEGEQPLTVPPSVRDVIARRMTHLTPQGRELLVLASVLGREFRREVLAGLAGRDDEHLLQGLDEAVASRLLSDVPGAGDRLRFEHVLVRDTLYDGLTAGRRMRLHRQVVEVLERLPGAPDAARLAELAQHAGAAGDHARALEAAREGAAHALEAHANEEAARLYGLALDALDRLRPADPLERFALLMAAGDSLAGAGDVAASKDRFLSAAEIARTVGRAGGHDLALAALGYGGQTVWQRAGDDHRLVPLLEDALSAVGDGERELRARLLTRLAGALRDAPSLEPRTSMSREAVAIARELDRPDLLAGALVAFFTATWGPDVDRLVPIADELRELARRTDNPATVLDALTLDGVLAWLMLAELDAATADRRYATLAGVHGLAADRWQAAMQDVLWPLLHGDFATAERLAERALARGGPRSADADCSYWLAMFLVRREQGRLGEIEELIREAAGLYPGYRSFRCFISQLELELGRPARARHAFDALAQDEFGALPRDCEWLFCLCILAEVAVGLGDREAAAVLYRLLAPYPRISAMAAGEVSLGPVVRFLGMLAAATGRVDDAARHFEDALELNARIGARPWLAHTQEDFARLLRERGAPGDDARARELLAACRATYRELVIARSAG